jgi:hypothetical protein
MPHGAEYDDGVCAGFKLFPERFRISTRDNLGFGIVPERVPSKLLLNSGAQRDRTNISAQDRLAPGRRPAAVPSARKTQSPNSL